MIGDYEELYTILPFYLPYVAIDPISAAFCFYGGFNIGALGETFMKKEYKLRGPLIYTATSAALIGYSYFMSVIIPNMLNREYSWESVLANSLATIIGGIVGIRSYRRRQIPQK